MVHSDLLSSGCLAIPYSRLVGAAPFFCAYFMVKGVVAIINPKNHAENDTKRPRKARPRNNCRNSRLHARGDETRKQIAHRPTTPRGRNLPQTRRINPQKRRHNLRLDLFEGLCHNRRNGTTKTPKTMPPNPNHHPPNPAFCQRKILRHLPPPLRPNPRTFPPNHPFSGRRPSSRFCC